MRSVSGKNESNVTPDEVPVPGKTRGEGYSLFFFCLLSVAVSLAIFQDGKKATYSALSGDQINILTICAKQDHPNLLQADMIVGEVRNVNYYIPWFVKTVRLLSLPNHDYLRGLNLLLLLTSLVYLWGWWMLFSEWGDKWLAALLAFLVRGILWPPGNEVWGISSLWTMLPRTLFLALLPWVLWGWIRGRNRFWVWVVSCFGCGLLANVHPISGACLALSLCLAEGAWVATETRNWRSAIVRTIGAGMLIGIGMMPFIWTYVTKVGSPGGVDPLEFEKAVRLRIRGYFFDPAEYLLLWLRPKWLLLLFAPWILFIVTAHRTWPRHKAMLVAMGAFSAGCLLTALVPFTVEALMRARGHQVYVGFQFIRACKYLLIPSVLLGSLGFVHCVRSLAGRFQHGQAIVMGTCGLILLLTYVARSPAFDNVPLLGDDVCRSLWPGHSSSELRPEYRAKRFDEVLDWIRQNTAETAKFVGPREIRVGALRSVVHDWDGAVVLLEGNPRAFVEAAQRERRFRLLRSQDASQLPQLLTSWSADFWVTEQEIPDLPAIFYNGYWRVYDLRSQL